LGWFGHPQNAKKGGKKKKGLSHSRVVLATS
jgi:hypothetical protein